MMVSLQTHICVTRPQWGNMMNIMRDCHDVSTFPNSLWASVCPYGTIQPHGSWSTLVQILAYCLMAASSHLYQCWFIINWTLSKELYEIWMKRQKIKCCLQDGSHIFTEKMGQLLLGNIMRCLEAVDSGLWIGQRSNLQIRTDWELTLGIPSNCLRFKKKIEKK